MFMLRLFILLTCLALAPQHLACAASGHAPASEVVIKADSITHDEAMGTVTATGNVVMDWEGTTLTADRATYNRTTGMLDASGNIVITKGDDRLKGESLTLDMETGLGELEHGSVVLRQSNATFTGRKIARTDETTIVIRDAELTTCEIPDPAWRFGADELEADIRGYAIGRNVIFYAKEVPVLYLPWIAFPVVRDRKTGLLFPRMGYSNTRGARLDIPVYLVISPSQDATFDLDLQTRRGIGTGVDYRYIRKRGSEGNAGGYLIYDLVDERWRGELTQTHKEIFAPDMNLRMAINLTSDRRFLHDYGEKSGEYNRQSNDTTLNALKTWQQYALTLNLRYSEDYYAPDNSRTLQTLPEIGLAAVRQQLAATPLYFDLDAGAANLYREAGTRGQRLQAFPRLTLVTGLPGYLNLSAYGGARLRAYATDSIPAGSTIDGDTAKVLPEAGATLSASLSRVYEINGGHLKKLRHELTPEISYRHVPEQDQSRLPFYDHGDRLVWQNIVYYGVTSLLGGKYQNGETTEYRNISRIKLMQGYSIEGTRRDLLTMVDAGRPLTDLILESDNWVHPRARLTFDARYNVYDNRISSAAPGLEFDDKRGNTLAAAYRMSRNEVEYFEGRLSTKIFRPWTFGYISRYSFDRGGFLEAVYSAEYRHKCWSVNLALHDRLGNHSFTVNFNLAGLTDNSFSKQQLP